MQQRSSSTARFLAVAALMVCVPAGLVGQSYSGTFTARAQSGGTLTLDAREARNGTVTGSLVDIDGVTFRFDGRIENEVLVGTMVGPRGSFPFEAERWENELRVFLYGTDGLGRPDYDDFEEITFFLAGTEPAPGTAPAGGNPLGGGPGVGNPLAGGATDPYVGVFTDGSVTLRLEGVAGEYRGQVTVGGQIYTVVASGGPSGIQGVLEAPDGAYPMSIQSIDGGLYLVSGGQQYHLFAQGLGPGGLNRRGSAGWPDGGYGPGGRAGAYPPSGRSGGMGGRGLGDPYGSLGTGVSERHPLASEWSRLLAGNKLARVPTDPARVAAGYPSRGDVYLCTDRTFALRDERSVGPGVPRSRGGGGFDGMERGRWVVVSDGELVALLLELPDGRLEYVMEREGGAIYANGQRVLVTPAEGCR